MKKTLNIWVHVHWKTDVFDQTNLHFFFLFFQTTFLFLKICFLYDNGFGTLSQYGQIFLLPLFQKKQKKKDFKFGQNSKFAKKEKKSSFSPRPERRLYCSFRHQVFNSTDLNIMFWLFSKKRWWKKFCRNFLVFCFLSNFLKISVFSNENIFESRFCFFWKNGHIS